MNTSPDQPTKNLFEWIVFGISSVIILGVAGSLAYFSVALEEGPPRIRVEVGAPVAENGRVRIPLTVTNSGNSVATDVHVSVNGSSGGKIRETELTIPFLPRQASRHGSVSFAGPDAPRDIEAVVVGYGIP